MFNHIPEHCGPEKLTHKINHHIRGIGEVVQLLFSFLPFGQTVSQGTERRMDNGCEGENGRCPA